MTGSSISMKGGGYYSKNTQGAKHVIDRAGDHVIEELAGINNLDDDRPFSIVDYGAADGGTSMGLVARIVKAVRARAKSRQITVTYTDLPHNDFSALFRLMYDPAMGEEAYVLHNDGVYVNCSGTSFYDQIVPDCSVDIGFSATAMHWLSTLPGCIDDHVHAVGAVGDQWQTFCNQALEDWCTILARRARELAPGGRLVMANFCIDESGRYLGNTGGVNMFDAFNMLWKELADEGVISDAEYQATAFPQFYKTIDQFAMPFEESDSAVTREGLRLKTMYTGVTKCPYRAEFDRVGDPVAFADAYVPTLRSWSEIVFFGSLDSSRPVEQRREIVDQLYCNYNTLVRKEPDRHAMDYVHTYLVAVKER
ncbi:MAG: hypothetical protein OXI60_05325 [Acidiferrobacterales bacterium]|nr:hypothetical protein [Acidiferrobacterales bacterium]